jgi:hypothetical protein
MRLERYLVRKKGGGKTHLWDGSDTKCRMASTGGLLMRKYVVSDVSCGRPICHMCQVAVGIIDGSSPERADVDSGL